MNAQPNFRLTRDQLREFHTRGFLGPFSLYDADEMKATWKRVRLELFDRSKAVYQGTDTGSGLVHISNYDRHLDNPFLGEHVCQPGIVDRVSSILGPDVLCWRTEFFPKNPGDEGTDWHQADTFSGASGEPQLVWPTDSEFGGTITVWTAFTDTDIETACMRFIPGTQRTMYYDESRKMHYNPSRINGSDHDGDLLGFFGYDYRELQKDPDWKPDVSRSVSVPMRAGEFIMFWSTLMHASHPHLAKTKNMRMAYATRYVPTCVKVYPDTREITEYGGTISLDKYTTVLVSGSDEFQHNRVSAAKSVRPAFVAGPTGRSLDIQSA
jgi:non-heme Fe2+,alpha-ketoglutarate-dependent halogenase